jgi:hypothetical protein
MVRVPIFILFNGETYADGRSYGYISPIIFYSKNSAKRAHATMRGRIKSDKFSWSLMNVKHYNTKETLLEYFDSYKVVEGYLTHPE